MAYHSYELIYTLMYQRHSRDFSEYLLHHIVTIMLIVITYSSNWLPVGSVIMLLHEAADVPLALFKMAVEMWKDVYMFSLYGIVLVAWIYMRIFFFPYGCIRLIYEESISSDNAM